MFSADVALRTDLPHISRGTLRERATNAAVRPLLGQRYRFRWGRTVSGQSQREKAPGDGACGQGVSNRTGAG
jgi:hypothetical protein